jgi:hypothetical protein
LEKIDKKKTKRGIWRAFLVWRALTESAKHRSPPLDTEVYTRRKFDIVLVLMRETVDVLQFGCPRQLVVMPYPFTLPTTGALSLSSHIRCESHPSLILAASTRRNVLRTALKNYKRSAISSRPNTLSSVRSALEDYLPYLFALDYGLSGKRVAGEEIHVTLENEIQAEWRPCLASSIPGRPVKRIPGKGLDFEVCFVLATLAFTSTLMARNQIRILHAEPAPDTEQRTAAIKSANQHLCQASAIHAYISNRSAESHQASSSTDTAVEIQAALAALASAEANLAVILKDDPYPPIVFQNRNKEDNEWMYKAPTIPKVRARLYGHGSMAATELAGKALALIDKSINEELPDYIKLLQRTSRAKACRFFGMDAELGGKVGEGIGWLQAAKKELGLKSDEEGRSKTASISRLKQSWKEHREDKKIKKGEEWGLDAGQIEESRVVLLLDEKWNKTNDIVGVSSRS